MSNIRVTHTNELKIGQRLVRFSPFHPGAKTVVVERITGPTKFTGRDAFNGRAMACSLTVAEYLAEVPVQAAAPVPSAAPRKSFIVARVDDRGQPLPSAKPQTHATSGAAIAEARRLAAAHAGQTFTVFEAISASVSGDITTRTL